ncbi:hypothetical protein DOTSEDRAFT_25343 [Dothistroma septosporum NZE10]|uniref:Uncharacterized protein n=1 Tax=Dothistroma septosporum (strain NZE10 / CBS 128990) TaxID=675120 RepID=M2XLU3_DOTSN|nr:hypothetical protein DOTSEDRAFT_25343 [Dothistroma septosporum NZE10]
MPSYDYTTTKEVLNEADKDRIVCIYLSSDPSAVNHPRNPPLDAHANKHQVDWARATKDFGSASVESFKKTTQNMLKKIEKAGGKIDGGAETSGSTSPVKPVAKAVAKKRKAKVDDEGAEGEKPKKKGRPARGKKIDEKVEGESGDDDEYKKLFLIRSADDEGEMEKELVKEESIEEDKQEV